MHCIQENIMKIKCKHFTYPFWSNSSVRGTFIPFFLDISLPEKVVATPENSEGEWQVVEKD